MLAFCVNCVILTCSNCCTAKSVSGVQPLKVETISNRAARIQKINSKDNSTFK